VAILPSSVPALVLAAASTVAAAAWAAPKTRVPQTTRDIARIAYGTTLLLFTLALYLL